MLFEGLLIPVMSVITEASAGSDLVSNLLTGGGFVFLAAVMGGLALWNKNQSESAKSIAEGSAELVVATRAEIKIAKEEASTARTEAAAAHRDAARARMELEDLQDASERERRKFKTWIHRQKAANDEHKLWDDELKAQVERLGGAIREAPPMATCSPDDPAFPFK